MSREYHLFQVDAFTTVPFSGNPAGVVLDAEGLDASRMQMIARELGNPETAFVFGPSKDDHDVAIRFFSPRTEVPICGHATIAAHYVLAHLGRSAEGLIRQHSPAGIREVIVSRRRDGDWAIRMRQGRPAFEPPLRHAIVARILDAVCAGAAALAPYPVQIVSTGHSKVMIGLRGIDALSSLRPDPDALTAISRDIGSNGFHFFVLTNGASQPLTECRMFAPAVGILEDPVTGNANGPLGAYLVRNNLVAHNGHELTFWSSQGVAMGRPGRVRVSVRIENGEPTAVEIGERAVIVFEGRLVACGETLACN